MVPLADHERARIDREMHHRRRFIPLVVREFLTWDEMAAIEVNAPDLPGILVDVGTSRLYPEGPALAHVVGYVAPPVREGDMGEDPILALPGIRVGRAGVEKFHDLKLRGRAGAVQMEVNAVGRVIRELDRQEGTPGQDIGLTIDVALQKQVLARLGDQSASAVVMDCRNGEVLAMTTTPSFDPSLFNSGVSQAQWIEWTQQPPRPADQQGDGRASTRPAPPSRWPWRWRGWTTRSSAPATASTARASSTSATRASIAGARHGHGALDVRGGLEALVRRVLLRTGTARRHRPGGRHGQPVRHRRGPRYRTAGCPARG